jgi:hypothetical protein
VPGVSKVGLSGEHPKVGVYSQCRYTRIRGSDTAFSLVPVVHVLHAYHHAPRPDALPPGYQRPDLRFLAPRQNPFYAAASEVEPQNDAFLSTKAVALLAKATYRPTHRSDGPLARRPDSVRPHRDTLIMQCGLAVSLK